MIGVVPNIHNMKCGGCDRIEPVILRFGCGHFLCLPKCWRNYARTKLDNRELLFDTPQQGADATLSCPNSNRAHGECKYYVQSHNLFKALGKARYENYQTLGMEHLIGRMLTPESSDGRIDLKGKELPPLPTMKRCTGVLFFYSHCHMSSVFVALAKLILCDLL